MADRIQVSARTVARLAGKVDALAARVGGLETAVARVGLNGHSEALDALAELVEPLRRLAQERQQRDAYDREMARHEELRSRRWRWLREPRTILGHLVTGMAGGAAGVIAARLLAGHHP